MGPEFKTKKKNASIMGNVLPPNNSVVHKSQVQQLDVTNFIHDSLSLSFTAITMSLKAKKHFSLFYFNATANSESRIYAITRKEITVITVVCRCYFDIEVIRIILFVTHSLVVKNIRYDRASFFQTHPSSPAVETQYKPGQPIGTLVSTLLNQGGREAGLIRNQEHF